MKARHSADGKRGRAPVLIVNVDSTPESFVRRIVDLVRSRTRLETDVKLCTAETINDVLMEADKAGVWFAFVVWPRNVEADTCALNFLRMSFGLESVGFEEQKLEQAVEYVSVEYARLQQLMYGAQQQYYAQQQMMFAAAQQQQQQQVGAPPMMPPPPAVAPATASTATTAVPTTTATTSALAS